MYYVVSEPSFQREGPRRIPISEFLDKIHCLTTGLAHFVEIQHFLEMRSEVASNNSGICRGGVKKRGRPRKFPISPSFLSSLSRKERQELKLAKEEIRTKANDLHELVSAYVPNRTYSGDCNCFHIGPSALYCLG